MCDKLDRKYKRRITVVLCGSGQTEGSCPGWLECDLVCVAGVSTLFFAAVGEDSASGPLGSSAGLFINTRSFDGMSIHLVQFSCWL